MKPRISAIIHTLNEESIIANAIRSVTPWVDEVLVIDMYSEDRTAEIARELGAKVFLHEKMGSGNRPETSLVAFRMRYESSSEVASAKRHPLN